MTPVTTACSQAGKWKCEKRKKEKKKSLGKTPYNLPCQRPRPCVVPPAPYMVVGGIA